METISIPHLLLAASRIGLGTWAMGGSLWGAADEQSSIDTIDRAIDLGITLIDTAPGYGFGQSEEVIGKALKRNGKRNQVILATKFGLNLENENDVFRDSRPASIRRELELSLKRLQVEAIDLYQVHWPDPHTEQTETAACLKELMEEGKIHSIGVSNYDLNQIKAFSKILPIDVIQHPFNIFEREAELELIPYAKSNGIATLGYSSLCRGLLTGALKENEEFEELRKNFDPKFRKPHFPQYLICVGRLQQWVQDKHRRSLVALAVRWSLDQGVDVALWGARRPEELQPLAEIAGWYLKAEDFAEIDQIIRETIADPIGPQFMSPPIKEHRSVDGIH